MKNQEKRKGRSVRCVGSGKLHQLNLHIRGVMIMRCINSLLMIYLLTYLLACGTCARLVLKWHHYSLKTCNTFLVAVHCY